MRADAVRPACLHLRLDHSAGFLHQDDARRDVPEIHALLDVGVEPPVAT